MNMDDIDITFCNDITHLITPHSNTPQSHKRMTRTSFIKRIAVFCLHRKYEYVSYDVLHISLSRVLKLQLNFHTYSISAVLFDPLDRHSSLHTCYTRYKTHNSRILSGEKFEPQLTPSYGSFAGAFRE